MRHSRECSLRRASYATEALPSTTLRGKPVAFGSPNLTLSLSSENCAPIVEAKEGLGVRQTD